MKFNIYEVFQFLLLTGAGGYVINLFIVATLGWKKKVDSHLLTCSDKKVEYAVLSTKVDNLHENYKKLDTKIDGLDLKLDELVGRREYP